MVPKNDCEEIRLDLFLLLHDELNPSREQEISQHLADCPSCRREREEMARTLETVSVPLPIITSNEETWKKLQARLRPSWRVDALAQIRNYPVAFALITAFGGLCLAWLLRINARMVNALRETFLSMGVQADWLFDSPISAFLAPLLFILLCGVMTLILSPLILQPVPQQSLDEERAVQEADKIS